MRHAAPSPGARRLRGGRIARLDDWLPVSAVLILASGVVVALAGAASRNLPLAAGGGATAALGLLVLMSGGWLDGLALVAISLPLPALANTDIARIAPAALLTLLVLVAWIVRYPTRRQQPGFGPMPRRATAALVAAVVLATLFAQHRMAAFREMTNLLLMIGLLLVAVEELDDSPTRAQALARLLAAVAGFTGLAAVLQSLGLLPARFELAGTPLYRATAGFGWPNELGLFMAVALPLAVWAFQSARAPLQKAAFLAAVTAAAAGLAVTFSRGGWLGLLAATPVLFLSGDRRSGLRLSMGLVLGVVGLDLLLGGMLSNRAVAAIDDPYVVQRLALMLTGLLMFLDHPVVGVGPGGFAESLPEYGPQVSWLWDYVGSAHNAYVEVAAEMGSIGLLAFVAFLGTVLVVLLRSVRQETREQPVPPGRLTLRRALLWSFAAVCTVSFSVWPLAHGIGQLAILVAAMGLVLAQTRDHRAGEQP